MSDVPSNQDAVDENRSEATTTPGEPKLRLRNVLILVVPAVVLIVAAYFFFGRMGGLTWLGQAMGPRRVPVTGQVFFNGEPLADAEIATRRADSKRGSLGWADEEGRFSLKTDVQGDFAEGAYIGEHIVTIQLHAKTGGVGEPPLLSPPEYASFDTTPLRIQVTKAENHFEFTLEGEPEITPEEVAKRGVFRMNLQAPANLGGGGDRGAEQESNNANTKADAPSDDEKADDEKAADVPSGEAKAEADAP